MTVADAIQNATVARTLLALGLAEPDVTPRQRQTLARHAKEAAGLPTQRRCAFEGCRELVTTFKADGELGKFCFPHSGARRSKKAEAPDRGPAIRAWWANYDHSRGPLGSKS